MRFYFLKTIFLVLFMGTSTLEIGYYIILFWDIMLMSIKLCNISFKKYMINIPKNL